MLSDIITQQRMESRKSIARCEKLIKDLKSDDRDVILKVIAVERDFLAHSFNDIESEENLRTEIIIKRHAKILDALKSPDNILKFAEMMPTVPGAPDEYVRPNSIPTFGKLIKILEQNLQEEGNSIAADPRPSANDIKRWALKSAVLEYYQGLGANPEIKVTDTVGNDRTIPALAPNKNQIYNIWMQKLDAQTKADDKYKLSMEEYDEAVDRGTPRGGAFEKLLDRYREDFMAKLWQQHYEEVSNGSYQG